MLASEQPLPLANEPGFGLAPVALFAFRRPDHTRRVLAALDRNPEFQRSALHVFCDAARHETDARAVDATRQIVRDFAHPRKVVVEASANRGLAASIVAGVSALCRDNGRAIVVEDDLLVAPSFLAYMNAALVRYEGDARVMQVSGYMFPVRGIDTGRSVFLPFTTSWGWAVWGRSWRRFDAGASGSDSVLSNRRERHRFDVGGSYPYSMMLKRQLAGMTDSWAIRWYLSVFLQNGRVLFPGNSLVQNIGFDGSGTHCDNHGSAEHESLPEQAPEVETLAPVADAEALRAIRAHFRRQRGWKGRIGDYARELAGR